MLVVLASASASTAPRTAGDGPAPEPTSGGVGGGVLMVIVGLLRKTFGR